MYSKNDYRYYLEHRLAESDDYLAHYGVKGMKWKKHLKKKFNDNYDVYNISGEHGVYGGPNGQTKTGTVQFKERGIESKNAYKYLSVGSHKYSDGRSTRDLYFSPTKKERDVKKGRVTISTGSEGSHISIDTTKKKRKKKNISNIRKKYGLYRETPKGQKLKGSRNIYVSHE